MPASRKKVFYPTFRFCLVDLVHNHTELSLGLFLSIETTFLAQCSFIFASIIEENIIIYKLQIARLSSVIIRSLYNESFISTDLSPALKLET